MFAHLGDFEEEIILRRPIFKHAILEKYDHRCAVSGMKIAFQGNVSMVDACHIVPFAESYDDTITNGIALSPTFHRAFDRGLITVSDDYRIVVHPKVKDYYPQVGILQFHLQPIRLPSDARFYPSPEKLARHRKRFEGVSEPQIKQIKRIMQIKQICCDSELYFLDESYRFQG